MFVNQIFGYIDEITYLSATKQTKKMFINEHEGATKI